MIIDIVTAVLICLALFKGLRNGLVMAIFSFLAFIIGMAAAVKLSAVVAGYLAEQTEIGSRWLPFLAFIIVFFVVVLVVRLSAKAVEAVLRVAMLGWLNRIGGFLLYALLYLFLLSLFLFYAIQMKIIKPSVVDASMVYPYLKPIGPTLLEWLAYLLPFLRQMFQQLQNFFGKF